MKKYLNLLVAIFEYFFLGIPAFVFSRFYKIKHKDLWLIMEDGKLARDNGYWFFKFLCEKHPEQDVIFVIDKKSIDFEKVSKLGKTCGYRNFTHWFYFFACSKEISTHPHCKPTNYIQKLNRIWPNKTYFIQHGVIRDFLGYTNDLMKLKLFVTSTKDEYNFVLRNFGYDEKVVRLLGLPRYDNLLNCNLNKKQILVMPTWRGYLQNVTEKDFKNSVYFNSWKIFLTNNEFINWLEKNDLQLIFYMHKEMQKFNNLFNFDSNNIKIVSVENSDVQTLLKESAILITDYSSVFFDFAYMLKPVFWYIFDRAEYEKGHHKKGYFKEEDSPLGEMSMSCDQLIEQIKKSFKNNFELSEEKKEQIKTIFNFRDKKNSERVYKEIKNDI